jgi:hypothetical protein
LIRCDTADCDNNASRRLLEACLRHNCGQGGE